MWRVDGSANEGDTRKEEKTLYLVQVADLLGVADTYWIPASLQPSH